MILLFWGYLFIQLLFIVAQLQKGKYVTKNV